MMTLYLFKLSKIAHRRGKRTSKQLKLCTGFVMHKYSWFPMFKFVQVNNHAANLWKDYYLDHKLRIDKLVSPQANTPVKTVKKPSPFLPPPAARAKSNDSIRTGSSSRVTQTHRPSIKKERISPKPFTSLSSKPAAPSKRRTINSITAHEPSLNLKLLPPQADIKLPDPPSRPPTPPTRVVRGSNGGNRYTPEDKEFFIKFIHYELENDPSLTKHDLCVKLAEKVC
jgi:hypothetical protein